MSITSIRCPGYFEGGELELEVGTPEKLIKRHHAIKDPEKWEPATVTVMDISGKTKVRCGACIDGTCTAGMGFIADGNRMSARMKVARARQIPCIQAS